MRYIDVKRYVSCNVKCYTEGRYTVSECIRQIDRDIQCNTNCIPDIDTRISQQNKLYLYGMIELTKAIKKMERV